MTSAGSSQLAAPGINGISNISTTADRGEFAKLWAGYPTRATRRDGDQRDLLPGHRPRRFVPTYMIYCAKVRPDTFLITQNALADNTYMSVMRDLYGDVIWIPSQQTATSRSKVRGGRPGRPHPAGADVQFENGRSACRACRAS